MAPADSWDGQGEEMALALANRSDKINHKIYYVIRIFECMNTFLWLSLNICFVKCFEY